MISYKIFQRLSLPHKRAVVRIFTEVLSFRAKHFLKEKTKNAVHLRFT